MRQPASDKLPANERGIVLLLSVLIAMVVGVAIGISVIMAGLVLSQGSLANRDSAKSRGVANACVESALQQIRNSTSYTGNNSVTIGSDSCSYTVTAGSGEARTITASSTSGTTTRRATVQISAVNPLIVISSWLEQ